jgi:AcrR family transcriptional regulator
VATARTLFAERGFRATSIEDIVRAAGVTRGALYHHFESKTDVFRAVFEDQERELAAISVRAAQGKRDPWRHIEAGCMAFLDACLDPRVQQIALLDGPAVLGWEGAREIERRYTLSLWRLTLEEAVAQGKLGKRPIEPLAHLLFGALCEGAMMAVRADDQRRAMRELRREFRNMLESIANS